MVTQLGLLGNGGQADETAEFSLPATVTFRAVSKKYLLDNRPDLIDIAAPSERYIQAAVTAAVGPPGLRRSLVLEWPGSHFRSVVAASAVVSPTALVGEGSVIAPGAVVSSNAALGRHVIINIGASVSHDSVLGDYVTLAPGARVAGGCSIGDGVFIGIGAVVSNGVSIASGSIIGAGATVVETISAPGVYVGSPTRLVRETEGWLREL